MSSTATANPSVAPTTRSNPAVLFRTIAAPVIGNARATESHRATGNDVDIAADSMISSARISGARPGEVIVDPRTGNRTHRAGRDRAEHLAGS